MGEKEEWIEEKEGRVSQRGSLRAQAAAIETLTPKRPTQANHRHTSEQQRRSFAEGFGA